MGRITATALARQSGEDLDDVLIKLWDANLTYVTTGDQPLKPQDVRRAELACGIEPVSVRMSVAYWCERLSMTRSEFEVHAADIGVKLSLGARKLPKGGLAKFDRAYPRLRQGTTSARKAEVRANRADESAFVWRDVGHRRLGMHYLTAEEIENVHEAIAYDFAATSDPISPVGVRDRGLLESAADRPRTSMGEVLKYPTVEMAAAALMHSVTLNHAFYNGNKRTALVATLSFLDRNGFTFDCGQAELFQWTVRVAAHGLVPQDWSYRGDREVLSMAQWISAHSRAVEVGERVITWSAMRKRLNALGCQFGLTGNNGGRMLISRVVKVQEVRWWSKRERDQELRYVIPYGGEGRVLSKVHLQQMRRALQLSEEYGIDSIAFYGSDRTAPDEFISRYRKTLQRLAKL